MAGIAQSQANQAGRPMANKPKNKKPKIAKKELLLDTVGQSLVDQLNGYDAQNTDSCLCCASWGNPRKSPMFLSPEPYPIHRATITRSHSSGRGSSNSSDTLVDRRSASDTHLDLCEPSSRERRVHFLSKLRSHTPTDAPNIDDIDTRQLIEILGARYGTMSHMGMLDRSYRFFINEARTGALCYKLQSQVAIVGGDPLCEPDLFTEILDEFETYRKRFSWNIAFMGASETFVKYARQRNWNTMQFGMERVLNPMTNDVLLERSSKRVIVQNKQLLHPDKGGITIGVYVPASGEDLSLQSELTAIYEEWRQQRNQTATTSQAFITVYNPFDLPNLMTFIYTRDRDGVANGFAALRRIGANQGYHIDPCIAAPGAPKGISDLLTYAAMAFLNRAGVSYLSLGYEPLETLGQVTGMSSTLERVTRSMYYHTYQRLPIRGKKAYHDKFRPDPFQDSGLYLVFPSGVPGLRQMVAMAHMANISIRKLFRTKARNATQQQASEKQTEPSSQT